MKRAIAIAVLVCASAAAYADKLDPKLLTKTCADLTVAMYNPDARPGVTPPEFVFGPSEIDHGGVGTINGYGGDFASVKVAVADDGQAAWVQGDFDEAEPCTADPCKPKVARRLHYTMLFDAKNGWQPKAGALGVPVSDADQAAAVKKGTKLAAVKDSVDKGAEDAVKVFKDSIGDPAKFSATISDRADAVMFGSAPKETFTGGMAIKAQLASWKLAFAVDGGVSAALTSSKTVAWVAANVKAGGAPYRLFAIYEKTKAGWKVASLSFSFVVPKI